MKKTNFPEGWNEERVRKVIAHYETQTEEEAVAEDEAAFEETDYTTFQIPVELVSVVRDIVAEYQVSKKIKKTG